MTNKKLFITVLVLLCMAVLCIYTIMGGSKTMTLAFLPDETGNVSLGGATLEPMTLYAYFENAAEEGAE